MDLEESAEGLLIHGRRLCRICEHFCRRPEALDVCCECAMFPEAEWCEICAVGSPSIVRHSTTP
jgi:hypothetical protein